MSSRLILTFLFTLRRLAEATRALKTVEKEETCRKEFEKEVVRLTRELQEVRKEMKVVRWFWQEPKLLQRLQIKGLAQPWMYAALGHFVG